MDKDMERSIYETFGVLRGATRTIGRFFRWQLRPAVRRSAKGLEAFSLLMSPDPRAHPSKDNRLRKRLGLPRYRARRARAIAAKAGER